MTAELLDMVAIVATYLREDDAVDVLSSHVGRKNPPTFDEPWVRIHQLDAQNVTGTREVEHLVAYYLQIDCYAGRGNQGAESGDLARAVRAALVAAPKVTFDEAVVTDVHPFSMPDIPDPDLNRERVMLDVAIYAHHH